MTKDVWNELDLDRWTWELPRDTPGPYVAEHIPKPLITDWIKKWKPLINDALEKAEKFDKLVKLKPSQKLLEYMTELRDYEQKLEAIKTELNNPIPTPEWKLGRIKEILEGEQTSGGTEA